jgi:hypothetical protein
VTPEQQKKMLAGGLPMNEIEGEARPETAGEKAAEPRSDLQTYNTYTENSTSEMAMLCNELIRFQKNGLAGPDSIAQYRSRIQELGNYLHKLEAHAASGVFEDLDGYDDKRLEQLLNRNRSALAKMEQAMKESRDLEEHPGVPFSREQTPQAPAKSKWEGHKAQAPQKPNLASRAWNFMKNPRKWFT